MPSLDVAPRVQLTFMELIPRASALGREPIGAAHVLCIPMVLAVALAAIASVGQRLGFAPYQLVVIAVIVLMGRRRV